MIEPNYAELVEEAYKPDLTDFFRPYATEYEISKKLESSALHHERVADLHGLDALHLAWCELHSGITGSRIHALGARQFVRDYRTSLRDAEEVIEDVVAVHIPELQMCAEPVDGVAARSDPLSLVRYAGRDRSVRIAREESDVRTFYPFAESWAGRPVVERKEALRRLAVGNQYLSFHAVDPQQYVEWDVAALADRLDERHFSGDTVTLRGSFVHTGEPDEKTGDVLHPDYPIFIGERFIGQPPKGSSIVTELYDCHVVVDGGVTYFISSTLRPKPKKSLIIKAGRGRAVLDRRGSRHILVGVSNDGIHVRAPTPADLRAYQEILRARFWTGDLVEIPDPTAENADSNSGYAKEVLKILGRYVRPDYRDREYQDRKRWVAPTVEHISHNLDLHLRTKYGRNGMSHAAYRQRNVASGVLKDWFGDRMSAAGLVLPKR
ncbi:MAG: hypothetical protein WC802_03285 [Patescibacteria group bacterium]